MGNAIIVLFVAAIALGTWAGTAALQLHFILSLVCSIGLVGGGATTLVTLANTIRMRSIGRRLLSGDYEEEVTQAYFHGRDLSELTYKVIHEANEGFHFSRAVSHRIDFELMVAFVGLLLATPCVSFVYFHCLQRGMSSWQCWLLAVPVGALTAVAIASGMTAVAMAGRLTIYKKLNLKTHALWTSLREEGKEEERRVFCDNCSVEVKKQEDAFAVIVNDLLHSIYCRECYEEFYARYPQEDAPLRVSNQRALAYLRQNGRLPEA